MIKKSFCEASHSHSHSQSQPHPHSQPQHSNSHNPIFYHVLIDSKIHGCGCCCGCGCEWGWGCGCGCGSGWPHKKIFNHIQKDFLINVYQCLGLARYVRYQHQWCRSPMNCIWRLLTDEHFNKNHSGPPMGPSMQSMDVIRSKRIKNTHILLENDL